MAHLLIDDTEEKLFKKLSPQFPANTTIVVSSVDGSQLLRRWRVDPKDGWTLDVDFVENNRAFTPKEKEEFLSKLTKTKVVDFFLTKGDDVPYREYNLCSNKEWELMKYIRHSGCYYLDGKTRIGTFQFWVREDAKVRTVLSELKLVLKRVKKHFPQVKEYPFGIMERTLSEFGVYQAVVDTEQEKAKLTVTKYGRTEDLTDWLSYQELIETIKKRHPYGD